MDHRTTARNSVIAAVLATMGMMACTGILGVTEVPEAVNSVDVPEAGDNVQGSDAGDGGTIVYVPTPCETGAKQCYGAIPQTCNAKGEWDSETECPFACKSGACTGVCVPKTKQCAGTTPQTCDSDGQWQSEAACANACKNGACTGVCTPSSKQCSGNGLQTCDADGAWGDAVACASSTPACNGGSCGTPPSCNGLTNNCGTTGTDNCCSSIVVPGGAFFRSSDPKYPATISAFRLDTYEVTVGRFKKFLASYAKDMTPAGAGKNPNNPNDSGWNKTDWDQWMPATATNVEAGLKCSGTYPVWTDSNQNRPVNCVSWYEAQAFCIWDGGRLPTEAEWNYAAAGGGVQPQQQRVYPWGNDTISKAYASYYDGNNGCIGNDVNDCSLTDILSVGSKSAGKNPLGHADLGGNVWEWVQDFYTQDYSSTTCSDCANLTGTSRLARGGSFIDDYTALWTKTRGTAQDPKTNNWAIGFRCARSQ